MSDMIDELCVEFPEIERKSIEHICKSGLSGIRKILGQDEELLIKTPNAQEIKFYIPCSPEVQDIITKNNRRKRLYAEIRKKNGQKSE